MTTSQEIERLMTDLQSAILTATGRVTDLRLEVAEVDVNIKTTVEIGAGGELDIKVFKVGGGVTSGRASSISITFVPSAVAPAASFEGEIVDALEVIEQAIASLERQFALSSATIEIAFTTTVEGKISLVIGANEANTQTHTATIKLTSA